MPRLEQLLTLGERTHGDVGRLVRLQAPDGTAARPIAPEEF